VVDVDGDTLEDLIVIGTVGGPITLVLYRNNGNGTFTDVTSSWPGLRPSNPETPGFSAWADFDNDGDADVIMEVCNSGCAQGAQIQLRFLRNNRIGTGEQSFTLIQALTFTPSFPQLAAFGDYDNDGDLDVFVGGGNGPSLLLKNQLKESGSVSFTDVSASVGVLTDAAVMVSAHWIDGITMGISTCS
jgi:hypothetical protein